MVRIRLEARERLIERRREIRKRLAEQIREELRRRLYRDVRELIRRYRERYEEMRETLRLISDIIHGRSVIMFKVMHYDIPKGYAEVVVDDKYIESLPPELKDVLPSIFVEIARARGITKALTEKYPQLIPILLHYIARYRAFPCKHDAIAIKITPVTIKYFAGLKVTYFVLRYSKVSGVRADPYLGHSKPIDIYFSFISSRKPANELINSMNVVGEGTADMNDTVTIYINTVRNRTIQLRVRHMVLQPHLVKYYFSKEAGREEMLNYFGHCSLYLMQVEYSKAWRLRETGDRLLLGRRGRRKFKEVLYYYGLRA